MHLRIKLSKKKKKKSGRYFMYCAFLTFVLTFVSTNSPYICTQYEATYFYLYTYYS